MIKVPRQLKSLSPRKIFSFKNSWLAITWQALVSVQLKKTILDNRLIATAPFKLKKR